MILVIETQGYENYASQSKSDATKGSPAWSWADGVTEQPHLWKETGRSLHRFSLKDAAIYVVDSTVIMAATALCSHADDRRREDVVSWRVIEGSRHDYEQDGVTNLVWRSPSELTAALEVARK